MNDLFVATVDNCRDLFPLGRRGDINRDKLVSLFCQGVPLDDIPIFNLLQLLLSKYRKVMSRAVKLYCHFRCGNKDINLQALREKVTGVLQYLEAWKLVPKAARQVCLCLAPFELLARHLTPLYTVLHRTRLRTVSPGVSLNVTQPPRDQFAAQKAGDHLPLGHSPMTASSTAEVKFDGVFTPQDIVYSVLGSGKSLLTNLTAQGNQVSASKAGKLFKTNQEFHIDRYGSQRTDEHWMDRPVEWNRLRGDI